MRHPQRHKYSHRTQLTTTLVTAALTWLTLGNQPLYSAPNAPGSTDIAQVPLTVTIPTRPQVMIAIGNSQSMDGNLSGAIMTGSGALRDDLAVLENASSPKNFKVPEGFTPPITGGEQDSEQPYTVIIDGIQHDNSPSRLNIAKTGIRTILEDYMASTDFGLMSFDPGDISRYDTWVYYMSQDGSNFTFTDIASENTVPNPCYDAPAPTLSVLCNALNLQPRYAGSGLATYKYVVVGDNSDTPEFNDVFYGFLGIHANAVCVTYGGRSYLPEDPPTLEIYNQGKLKIKYSLATNRCPIITFPTNSGSLASSQEVMYVSRGFGYGSTNNTGDAGIKANDGKLLVAMQSTSTTPVAEAVAKFLDHLEPETDNVATGEIKASAGQAPLAGLLKGSNKYFTDHPPAATDDCPPKRYVVLLTDGLPTMDLNGKNWPPLGSEAAEDFKVAAAFNPDGSLNRSDSGLPAGTHGSKALTDTIDQLKALRDAGIKTYIIGLGAGVDPTKNPEAAKTLNAMAIAGGTAQEGDTKYFPATSPSALSDNLRVILEQIQTASQAVASNAVNSHYINTNTLVYQASFSTPSIDNHDWAGNLLALPFKDDGTLDTNNPTWDAQSQLDNKSWNDRVIATWDRANKRGIPFRWSDNGIRNNIALKTPLIDRSPDRDGVNALQYLRGNRALEQPSGPYRARTHVLGDIVNSSPVYVGAPNGAFFDSSYTAFIKNKANRKPMVYVGANDGMLHGFNARTGEEVFAFIPAGVYNNIPKLTRPEYDGQHRFFVDATPVSEDVYFDTNPEKGWHTLLVGGEGAGGKSIYALDITDPNSMTSESTVAQKVLWEFTNNDMGFSFGTPAIDRTAAGTIVAFGNGYNSANQRPVFYALNARKGTIKAKIKLCDAKPSACNNSKPNGLSSVRLTNTTGALGALATVAYAGDLQGNLWRIDLTDRDPDNWSVRHLFKARDPNGKPQPITTTPVTSLNPMYPTLPGNTVYFGTGKMLGVSDLGSTQIQTMYGIYDPGLYTSSASHTITLIEQTFDTTQSVSTKDGGTIQARVLSDNPVVLSIEDNESAVKGWYVNLPQGERIITNPALDLGAVIVTSNQPPPDACTAGGKAWLNLFNYATGGAFTKAQLTLTETIVNGIELGDGFATGVNVTVGANGRTILLNQSTNDIQTLTFDKLGGTNSRSAWWEVK